MCWWIKKEPAAEAGDEDWMQPNAMASLAQPGQLNYSSSFNTTYAPVVDDQLRCSTPSTPCPSSSRYAVGFCRNGGICCSVDGHDYCVCDPIWNGIRCMERLHSEQSLDANFGHGGVAIAVIVVVLVLVVVGGLLAFFLFKQRQRRISDRRNQKSADKSSGVENGETDVLNAPHKSGC